MVSRRQRIAVLGTILLGSLVFSWQAAAQDPPAPLSPTALYHRYERGVAALEADSLAQAVDALDQVYHAAPTYAHPVHGAVSYWLGRALHAQDRETEALLVWTTGFRALQAEGLADVNLADAVVRAVYRQEDKASYTLAAEAYLLLLAHLDVDLPPAQRALIEDHLQWLVLILPEPTLKRAGLDTWQPGRSTPRSPTAGAYLNAWWRSRDPLPATRNNERLEEHLERIAYATAHFSHPRTGLLDDRAAIYIRLGPPPRTTSIAFDSFTFRRNVLNTISSLTASSFPANTFWVYPHLDQAAQFLFIRQPDGMYRLGEPNDLIPATLTMGLGFTRRGTAKAEALIWTMYEVYRQLAQQSPVFADRFNETADFIERLEDNAFLAEMDQRSAIISSQSADATQNRGGNTEAKDQARTMGLPRLPNVYAETMIEAAHSDDKIARERRAERIPPSTTNTLGDLDPLDMAVRLARFLDPDGTTRTEIYWTTSARALSSRQGSQGTAYPTAQAAPYLLALSIAQQTSDHRDRAVHYEGYLIDAPPADAPGGVLTPRTYTVRGDTGTYHLAMQWDQYHTRRDQQGQPTQVGRHLKANTYRADTLTALQADERVLEMSDLKPLVDSPDAASVLDDNATPYPFRGVQPQTPLGLYFEVYHLTYGADDRTHYTVSYTVTRHRESNLLRLRRGNDQTTTATTTYTGASRTTEEYIVVDLNDWEGTGELVVTVQVTDIPTGRQVERSLTFVLEG